MGDGEVLVLGGGSGGVGRESHRGIVMHYWCMKKPYQIEFGRVMRLFDFEFVKRNG